jgi:hypothetical protein
MREWIKALPVSVGLPVVMGAASVKPEDAASNVAAWIEFLGFHNVPHWLTNPNADQHVIAGACVAAALYSFALWGPYRKKRYYPGAAMNAWGPWVLIVAAPLAGLIWLWLRPVEKRELFSQTAHVTAHTQTPMPAAPTLPTRDQSKRETTTKTIRQLKALYEGRTALQAEGLIKPFKGLWVEAEGEITLINANPAVLLKSGGDMVECWFSKEWVNVLGRYSLHETLKVRGKISDTQNGAQIYLTDCEVVGVTP